MVCLYRGMDLRIVLLEKKVISFLICLWDSMDVIRELFDNYEKLSPALKAEIPLNMDIE